MLIKIIYNENDDLLGFHSSEDLDSFIKENTHDKFLALSLKYSHIRFITQEAPEGLSKQEITLFCKKIIFHELYEVKINEIVYRDYRQYWTFIKNEKQEWELFYSDWIMATDWE